MKWTLEEFNDKGERTYLLRDLPTPAVRGWVDSFNGRPHNPNRYLVLTPNRDRATLSNRAA